MPEKDPFTYSMLTYLWVIGLSAWAGFANFMRKVRTGQAARWNINELIGELVASSLAGLITFWLCEAGGVKPLIAAACIAISGHMGSRAIFHFERWLERRFSAVTAANDETHRGKE